MTDICKYLFVYGTLLKGEERSPYLHDCRLIRAFEVPGSLFDTGLGYPTAVFEERSGGTISGELYSMPDPIEKLRELDIVEQVKAGFYERVSLRQHGIEFLSYQAGGALLEKATDENKISHGNWRRYSSLARSDPASFALNFEKLQEKAYKVQASDGSDGHVYLKGDLPVLICANHATAHVRMGKLKRQEFFTGALAQILHNTLGCHVLYTNSLSQVDPNYYDDSPFKDRLTEIADRSDINLLIDLHGTGPDRDADIFPGTGESREFLLGNESHFDALLSSALSRGITIGSEDVFPAAKQMTVTKYSARKLRLPAIQLEIVRELRRPESSPRDFNKLVAFMNEFLSQLSFS